MSHYSENLIEVARDAIIRIDEKGIVNVLNRSAENIFGYLKEEILGQKIITIIPDDTGNNTKDGLERLVRTGDPKVIDNIYPY